MASPGGDPQQIKRGLDIYTGGTALQQLFIFVFIGLMVVFQRRCSQVDMSAGYSPVTVEEPSSAVKKSWKPLLYALYAALFFITVSPVFTSSLSLYVHPIQGD